MIFWSVSGFSTYLRCDLRDWTWWCWLLGDRGSEWSDQGHRGGVPCCHRLWWLCHWHSRSQAASNTQRQRRRGDNRHLHETSTRWKWEANVARVSVMKTKALIAPQNHFIINKIYLLPCVHADCIFSSYLLYWLCSSAKYGPLSQHTFAANSTKSTGVIIYCK